MRIEDFGYNTLFEQFRMNHHLEGFEIGRVIAAHKDRYIVKTSYDEYEAEITGHMRFTTKSHEDFPAVGDWVALIVSDPDFAIIHTLLPRFSILKRQAVGQSGGIQVIAANIDFAFLMQAVDRDFNINRLERYLTICHSSKVNPIILLSKIDLISEQQLNELLENLKIRIKDIPVIAISSETKAGYDLLKTILEKGKTYCLLGSSGVGKSTLSNHLLGKAIMQTAPIGKGTNKGKHITSHRELIVLENGAILVDNPGMREVGITDSTNGLEITFNPIVGFAQDCKFKDCTHLNQIGCAVLEAVEKGEIDRTSYENYLKMEREKTHFESTVEERRKRDREFGKMVKNYKKGK